MEEHEEHTPETLREVAEAIELERNLGAFVLAAAVAMAIELGLAYIGRKVAGAIIDRAGAGQPLEPAPVRERLCPLPDCPVPYIPHKHLPEGILYT